MKMNADKCHLFVSGNKHEHRWAKIGDDQIWESRTVKLCDITIDELKFDEYLSNICKKAHRKTYCTDKNKKITRFQQIANFIQNIF